MTDYRLFGLALRPRVHQEGDPADTVTYDVIDPAENQHTVVAVLRLNSRLHSLEFAACRLGENLDYVTIYPDEVDTALRVLSAGKYLFELAKTIEANKK